MVKLAKALDHLCMQWILSFFFKFFFLMWTIFKVFMEFVTILLLFFLSFGFLAMRYKGFLAP